MMTRLSSNTTHLDMFSDLLQECSQRCNRTGKIQGGWYRFDCKHQAELHTHSHLEKIKTVSMKNGAHKEAISPIPRH